MNKYCKDAGYRINVQNSIFFLYTDNKISEKEMKPQSSFKPYSLTWSQFNLSKTIKPQLFVIFVGQIFLIIIVIHL